MRTAVCPGSFDPVTNGHLDVFVRAAAMADEVVVAVLVNKSKSSLFGVDERIEMLREVVAPHPNIRVDSFSGLLVDYCTENRITTIVKGLRAVSDFDNAIAHYRAALDISHDFVEAWSTLGALYKALGRYDEAEECCLKACELAPRDAAIRHVLATVYFEQARVDEAIEASCDPRAYVAFARHAERNADRLELPLIVLFQHARDQDAAIGNEVIEAECGGGPHVDVLVLHLLQQAEAIEVHDPCYSGHRNHQDAAGIGSLQVAADSVGNFASREYQQHDS